MRKWGTVITVSYALIILVLLGPGIVLLNFAFRVPPAPPAVWVASLSRYAYWQSWIPIVIIAAGQALVLFLSVDTSRQRLKPRAHILVSCLITGTLSALLTGAAIVSLSFGVYGDNLLDLKGRAATVLSLQNVLLCWAAIWVAWTIVFYLYFRNSNSSINRATSWLLKGSVLELLIAVPSHVIVRRRNDCSAPIATGYGIATGIAIMFLCFGPSVLLLYKKRMDEHASYKTAPK